MPPKLPKLDLMADAQYVANLENVSMWFSTCNSAFYYMGMLYLQSCITSFFLLIS